MSTPAVTEQDVIDAPKNMLAFKGRILSNYERKDLKPQKGFNMKFTVVDIYEETLSKGATIKVNYGPCHGIPGKQGDEVYVLALPNKTWWNWIKQTWRAPQFW